MNKGDPADKDATGKARTVPAAPAPGGGAEAYARWLEHVQRSRGRHAAITRNLYTWTNYKNWADKVKNSWDPDGGK